MVNLIEHYKNKIELLRNDTIDRIQNTENKPNGEYVFILKGKRLAIDIYQKEKEQLYKYHKETTKI